jgi:hypothetical protein
MKRILGAGCAVLVLAALAPAQAWANPQHERMKRCNAEAKEQALKGEARKAFMGTCLRGKHDAAAPAAAPGAPVAAAAAVPAQAAAPAPAAVAPAVAAPAVAAESVQKVSSEDKARQKACNRAATEQSLRGAKRKAFIGECMSG